MIVAGVVAVLDRHARLHDPRAPQRLPLARDAARRRPDGAVPQRGGRRHARRRRAVADAGWSRRCCSTCPVFLFSFRRAARSASARRATSACSPPAAEPPARHALDRRGCGSSRRRARRRRGGRQVERGSGSRRRPSPSPRVSPWRPSSCRRAISRSPSRAPGGRAGRPAISAAMRLRSCSAKCGVEAPISWRTSSTVTSSRRDALQAVGVLGLAHARLTRSSFGLRDRRFGGRLAARADLEQGVDFGLRRRDEIALSSPISQP